MKAHSPLGRVELKTRRLILRPLRPQDYQVWFDTMVLGKPAQSKWDLEPRKAQACTRLQFRKIRRRHESLAKKDEYYWFGVFEKKSGKLVGQIDFTVFLRSTHQYANFGYQIYNRYWGRGYGQEAAAAGLRIGFRNLRLNRLEAAINLDNRKSIRMAKAIGLRREGVKRRYWFEHGRWVDHLIYVANPEDIGWRPRKPF